jgi:hypothetical protein
VEGPLHHGLQVLVDREREARPGHRRRARDLRDLATAAVHHESPFAVPAHEVPVVLELEPCLAHEISRVEPGELGQLQLSFGHLAHPA